MYVPTNPVHLLPDCLTDGGQPEAKPEQLRDDQGSSSHD